MNKTKKAITEKIREIVAREEDGYFLYGDEESLIKRILAYHPNIDAWLPIGDISGIEVHTNMDPMHYRSRGFLLHYTDGNEWAFSWHKALGNMSREDVAVVADWATRKGM